MTMKRQKWESIGVGDLVLLEEDAQIPADLLLLKVSQKNGDSFVQTANLDGERNLKRKSATLQGILEYDPKSHPYLSEKDYKLLRSSVIEYGRPQKELDKFGGNLRLEDEVNGTQDVIPLSQRNLILRVSDKSKQGSNLANTNWALGLIIYTGSETKLMQNQDKARYKISRLGRMVNRTMIVIVLVQMLFCLIGGIGAVIENPQTDLIFAERYENEGLLFLISFLTFYVLLGTFVPISLLVTLEIIRVLQMVLLQADKDMKDPETGQSFRAFNGIVPQDLGNITHLFTDKTGTLTSNHMQFKGFSFGHRNQEIEERENSILKNRTPRDFDSPLRTQSLNSERLQITVMATPETTPPKAKPSRFSLVDRLPIPERNTVPHSRNQLPSIRTEQEDLETDNEEPNQGTELTNRKEEKKPGKQDESPVKPREEVLKSLSAILCRPTRKRQDSDSGIHVEEDDTTERPFNLSRSFIRFMDRPIPFPPSTNRDYLYCLLLNICLCNDVIPVYADEKGNKTEQKGNRRGKKVKIKEELKTLDAKIDEAEREPCDYQGGSPDEIELVRTAKELGLVLLGNKADDIIEVLSRQEQKVLRFKLKHKFEFSSSKRRMTVIVQEMSSGMGYLFTKGADTAVFSLMRIEESMLVTDCTITNLTSYSQMGYRTLCFGALSFELESQRILQWEDDLKLAQQLPPSFQRTERLDFLQEEIEKGLHLLGASAVEDKLQKGVPECILDFKDAGITICMLTGDKLQTAQNIGFSSRIFTLETHVERLKEVENLNSFSIQLKELRKKLINRDDSLFTNLAQQHQENLMRASSSSFYSQQEHASQPHYKSQKFASTISAAGSDKIYLQISDELMRRSLINTRRKQHPTNAPRERRLTAIREGIEEESIVRAPRCICKRGRERPRLRGMHLSQGVVPLGGNQSPKEKSPEQKSHMSMNPRDNPQNSAIHIGACLEESKSGQHLIGLESEEKPIPDVGLIIDSKALDWALLPEHRDHFFQIFSLCTAVICCRATPKQKAEVVNLIRSKKSYRNKLNQWVDISALAIGDGGNDVNMIQQADIGVGIFGKEGNQAANAADYAFAQFRFLRKLVLVHGRFIALRFSYYIYFFFFKNCLLTFVQFFFAFESMFTGTTFWESFYLTNYNTLTGFPIGARTLVEQDIDLKRKRNAVFVPFLYRRARDQNLYFSYKNFGLWNVYGLSASWVVYIGVSRIYSSKAADVNAGYDSSMWGRSLTAFNILLVLLLVIILADSHHYNWLYWLCILFTHILVFPGFALIYNFIPNTEVSFNLIEFLWTWKFAFTLLIIVSSTYLPYFCLNEARRLFTPRHIDLLYDYYSGSTPNHAKQIAERRSHILSANVMTAQAPAPLPPEIQSHKPSDNSLNMSANSKQSSLPEDPDTYDFHEGSRHNPQDLDSVRKSNLFS